MNEEWRDVEGTGRRYQVSSAGRVRSRRGVLKNYVAGPGRYPVVTVSYDNGKRRLRTVHTLVAEAFLGPRPPGLDVRHKNDVKTDCRAENLHYGTRSQNMVDAVENGRVVNSNKTHCGVCGTEYDSLNTYLRPDGGRECRTCARRRNREYDERNRQRVA